ncbi:MAG TPA: hypothetical protein VK474_08440 [Chthoniobacterales bacterium]|nr:hypothetical protein [Chthoniobacterales bacterium]
MKSDVPNSDLPGDQGERLHEEGYVGSESHIEGSSARENLSLWIGVLGSAVVWFVQMQTNYTLVSWVCATKHNWVLYAISLVFLILSTVPGALAWRGWKKAAADGRSERESTGAGRHRFMALLGIMASALFFLLILTQALPHFFIDPCVQ